ncbi:uncharacterized protein V6R79_004366 [Siganus canaliculatus]
MEAITESYMKETEAVFRTAYYLAKKNRPFSDHGSLIELQELNGVNMGSILHSRYSATQIIQHVASEMRSKIVSSIIASSKSWTDAGWPIAFGLFVLYGHPWKLLCSTLKMLVAETRSTKERQMYRGLLDRVQSPEFICDQGLMYDTLHELSLLSQELQSRSITLLRAEHLLKGSIRVIQSCKESPGVKYSEALEAKKTAEYRSTALKTSAKPKSINPGRGVPD